MYTLSQICEQVKTREDKSRWGPATYLHRVLSDCWRGNAVSYYPAWYSISEW